MKTIKPITLSAEECAKLHGKFFHLKFIVPHCVLTPDGWIKPQHAGCWEYEGKWQDGKGHKKIKYKGRTYYVHRLSYMFYNNCDVPSGHVIDHTCRNPGCFNPMHLEAVPVKTNTERGNGKWIFDQGYTPENKNNDNNPDNEGHDSMGQPDYTRKPPVQDGGP